MNIKYKLLCRLGIHYPHYVQYSFYDYVVGKPVYKYECKECKNKWLATGKYSLFKVAK